MPAFGRRVDAFALDRRAGVELRWEARPYESRCVDGARRAESGRPVRSAPVRLGVRSAMGYRTLSACTARAARTFRSAAAM